MTITNIEGKIPIAADAAELVLAYLDELNTKLNKANVKNAYLIVSDVESMIIEALKRQGQTTKLGNEEVLSILNEEFDDQDEFIKIYLADMNPEIQEDKMDRFVADHNQRRLIRRPKAIKKIVKPRNNQAIVPRILRIFAASIPVILLLTAIMFNLASYYGNAFRYMEMSIVFIALGVSVFIMFEFITGLNGKLIVNIKHSILLRYTYRGLLISNIMMTWGQYYRLYQYAWNSPYLRNFNTYYISFQVLLITYSVLFVVSELMILMRDHFPKFYPLEPEFRPIIRLFTPPYLLVMSGLLIFFIEPFYWEFAVWGSILVYIGIYWSVIRKYKVSPRFYIVTILFLFSVSIFTYFEDVFYIGAYSIVIYTGLIVLKSLIRIRPRGGRGMVRKIKNKYADYYEQ